MISSRLPFCFLVTVLSGFIAFTTGCSQKDAPHGPTFTYAMAADPLTLDPAAAEDPRSLKVLTCVCEGLVRFKNGTTQVEPCLAETWTLSSDARTCILALRDKVKFHDGTELNPAVVVWNYQRLANTNATARAASSSRWAAFCSNIDSVRALDEQRVEIRLKNPNAAMLADLAMPSAALISPHAPNDYGDALPRHPVGTGPFRFHEWRPNDRVVLDVNMDYWGRKPRLGHVEFKTMPDSHARLSQLQTGQVHATDGLDLADIATARTDRNLQVFETPGLNLSWLAFNCRKPPMNRLEFRQAVAMTLRKAPLIESVYHGKAIAATCPLPPALRAPTLKVDDWPHDVERARGVIAQLQLVVKPVTISTNDAFGLKITFTTNVIEHVDLPVLKLQVSSVPQPYLPDPVRAAELIKTDLESIGLKVRISANDWNTHLATLRSGDYDLALHGKVSANGDFDDFFSVLDPATVASEPPVNASFLDDAELAVALKDVREQAQPTKRLQACVRALALIYDRLPIIPLAYADETVVARINARDFKPQPTPGVRLDPVRVK